ncbi:hypothetical protein PG984_002798 [Apiospora sp. TS-2023a]
MVDTHVKNYRLKMEKLKEYLDSKFPKKYEVKEGEDDYYIINTSKALTQDQLDDIEDLRAPKPLK